MPKVEIDYSNTIFYKIFCKDPAIKDLYVGLTTNFVQRKHAHKQSCKNEKAMNHNCKLYNAIRNAGGWENWQMEIIAFHNCADSYEARKKEQEYFEALGATLNSIEPFPKPKIKEPIVKIVKEKKILFCEPCNIFFSHWTTQETHNNTKKHHKMVATHIPNELKQDKTSQKTQSGYVCAPCDFSCVKKSNYTIHTNTQKHANLLSENKLENEEMKKNAKRKCDCGREYTTLSGLWKHKSKGCYIKDSNFEIKKNDLIVTNNNTTEKDELINYLMKENQEFKNLILKIVQNGIGNQITTNHTTELEQHNKIIVDSIGGSGNVVVEK
jgi:hypothetical protein